MVKLAEVQKCAGRFSNALNFSKLAKFLFSLKKIGKITSSETKLNLNPARSRTRSASTTNQELNINTELNTAILKRSKNQPPLS